MFKWFNNLKIRNKLITVFLVMIGLTIIVSVIALVSQSSAQNTVDDLLNTDVRITELSLKTDIAMLMARRNEKDYQLRYQDLGFEEARAKYVTQAQEEVAAIHANIAEIKRLEIHAEDVDQIEVMDQAISEYASTFLAVVDLLEQRGHVDAGLEGQFREKVHEIEAVVEAENLDQLTIDMLTMRRHEKDYLLRGDEKYVADLHETVARFKTNVAATDLSPAEQAQLVNLADEYKALFDQLVQADVQIAAGIKTYREAVHKVEPMLDKILVAAENGKNSALVNMQETAQMATWTVIGVSAAAAVAGLLIAFFLSRSIANTVNIVTRAAEGIAKGDLKQSVEINSKDELGNMAAAFQRMIAYMQQMAQAAGRLAEGDTTADVTPQSDKDVLGVSFNRMIAYQQKMAKTAGYLAQGDVTVDIVSQSTKDVLGNAFTRMISYQQQMAEAAGRLAEGDTTAGVTPQSDKDVLGVSFSRMIAYQQKMAHAAGRLAQGDLTIRVTPQSEKDALGNAFTRMIANLSNLIGQVQQGSMQVAGASRQLNASADQAGQASQGVATTMQQIAKGTSQQTQSITEATGNAEQMALAAEGIARGAQEQALGMQKTSDLISEMNGIVGQVGQIVGSVTQANAKVAQAARHGVTAVEQTGQGMETIRTRATVTAEKVKEMGNRSKEIGRIVETIDDIADKTDMLALNAAVEAARAGEHGRGFAVVADQVRKLSEDSKGATRDIDDLIERVQETINEAITSMENTVVEVDNGARLTGDTAQSLQDILQAAEEATDMAEQISEAVTQLKQKSEGVVSAGEAVSAVVEENTAVSEEMAANAQEVTDAMEGVASIAEENSAATEEVSASTEEMAAQIEEVVASAEELSALAEELRTATAQFRVNGSGQTERGQSENSPEIVVAPANDQPEQTASH